MNFFKPLVFRPVALVIIAMACFISSAGAGQLDENKAAITAKNVLNSEERLYIHGLIQEIESVFDFFREKIELFIDIRDKTPYRKFVGDLCACIDLFIKETLKPLEQRLKEAPDKNVPFYRGLTVVDELLMEFLDKLHNMRVVLLKYVSVKDNPTQAFKLATELEPHIKAIIAAEVWNKLEAKLVQVEVLMKQVEEQDIVIKLAQLKTVLKKTRGSSSALNISPTTLLTCIRKKIRYN